MESFDVVTQDLAGTIEVAKVLAHELRPGDTVLLVGNLASGKTTIVKAIASELGSTEVVTSPTFTLAQFYPTPRGEILHIDTYRLDSVAEFRDLGLDDYTDRCINLIEWGEKVDGEFSSSLTLQIAVDGGDDRRRIRFASGDDRWMRPLTEMRANIAAALG